ncbi:MAG: hypothetical protein LBB11_03620 [Puniceicoccales bacterium]|jgi:hypothetical protein|nr:hypothetical protein [Puniceicoccales bacterium]
MIYKKQFSQFPHHLKKQTVKAFMLSYFLEFLANGWLNQWCCQITLMPFFWLIFTKKYFPYFRGCFLFTIGFLWYFRAYPFSGLSLAIVAVILFKLVHKMDIDRLASILALCLQETLFIVLDPIFNAILLIRSLVASILMLYFLPNDLALHVSANAK